MLYRNLLLSSLCWCKLNLYKEFIWRVYQFFRNCEKRMEKIVRMMRLNKATAILIMLFSLLISNTISNSFFSHDKCEVQSNYCPTDAHLPRQPELVRTFENCHKSSDTFDLCIKNALNELTVYFESGKFSDSCLFYFSWWSIYSSVEWYPEVNTHFICVMKFRFYLFL